MRLFLTLSLTFICLHLFAQDAYKYTDYNLPVQIKELVLPIQDNNQLKQAELKKRKKGRPDCFAKILEVSVKPEESGTWDFLNNDIAIWRYNIISQGAETINLGFVRYNMPLGGELYLYGESKNEILGPFTPADNESHNQLWTPIIEGDEVTIEIQIPIDQINVLDVELQYVNHDFINVLKSNSSGSSGSCNVDVACGEEEGFPIIDEKRDIINAVGAFTINGAELCSGALINNARNDCKPYFLTADHCGINDSNAASVVVYWNYQNSECRIPGTVDSGRPGDGSRSQFNTGSSLLSAYAPSDFALVLLDDEISPDFNPFFAGWNMGRALPQSSVCIHHPNVEEKRISIDNDPNVSSIDSQNDTFIRVESWDLGTTEGGSSGAPLFNDNNEIIGVLNSGQATCTNNAFDDFGPMYISWEGGGTPETRLKDWLDPDGIGLTSLPGKNCSFLLQFEESVVEVCGENTDSKTISFSVNENFEDEVNIIVDDLPAGLNYEFENNVLDPGTESSITFTKISSLAPANYQITLQADDGKNTVITNLTLKVFSANAESVVVLRPENGSDNQLTNVTLEWVTESDDVDFQLSTDQSFSSIEEEVFSIKEDVVSIDNLSSSTQYYWRIRANNVCGTGEWANTSTFSTGSVLCSNSLQNSELQIISDDQADTITSSIGVSFSGIVREVQITNISGKHTWVGDLTMSLISPSGTKVNLLNDVCDESDDFSLGFSDAEESNNFACPITDNRIYKPSESLSAFNGESTSGRWRLEIIDNATLDGGSLDRWGLSICSEVSAEAIIYLGESDIAICGEPSASTSIGLGLGFSGHVSLSVDSDSESFARIIDNRLNGGEATTIEFNNLTNLASGTYPVVVTANDGQTSISETIMFSVQQAVQSVNLIAPPNGDIGTFIEPDLTWAADENVSTYFLQISSSIFFDDTILDTILTDNSLKIANSILEPLTEYYWRVASGNECGSKLSQSYSFTTEMESSTFQLEDLVINLFPNPASDFIHIHSSKDISTELELTLYDISGRAVIADKIDIGSRHIDLNTSLLPDGIYMLKVADRDKFHTEKIIIQH